MAALRKEVFDGQKELKLFQRKEKKSKWYKKKVKPSIGVTVSNQASLDVYRKGTSKAKSNPNQASVVLGQENCTTTQPDNTTKVPVASGPENNSPQVPLASTQENNTPQVPLASTQENNTPQVPLASTKEDNSPQVPLASGQENNSLQVPVASGQEKCKAIQPNNSPQVAMASEQDFVESPLRIL